MQIEMNVADVVYREDLYPRIDKSAATVQKYAEDLDVLPPIEVNQHNELIDGWHRWTGHKKNGEDKIRAIVTETDSDVHFLELAIERNASHGLQLSQEDKRDMARKIYHATNERERDAKKKHIAKILSVSERTVRDWLSRIDKDSKEARNKKILEMWMACHTQQEIAEALNVTRDEVRGRTEAFGEFGKSSEIPKSAEPAANHLTDFDVPIYNIWKFKEKSNDVSHFGNTEITIVDNLLYLYTQPFDIVVDPFAGGGTTAGICKKRFRRYWVSDRKPGEEHAGKIRTHDLTDGLPSLPRWEDVRLVYLDPPYWKQAEGQYSNDPTDLANMPLEEFNATLSALVKNFAKKLKPESYIALIIQPTQWKSDGREFVDHIGDLLRAVNLPVEMRFSCPYESQQCNAQMVEWAKANKKCLVLTRELIVWRTL